jgi:predicted unusual protein kinase regulating ubiquinone biosynthesis (AarF/ABC1/UbiB family)
VLTMEYCPGIKINKTDELDAAGLDRSRLARLTVESYLLQVRLKRGPRSGSERCTHLSRFCTRLCGLGNLERCIAKGRARTQVLRYGLFHADPHPGNIAVDPKTEQIIYYDFGMMGDLGVRVPGPH